ncbi:MAG: isochorismatase family protein [Bacteriovoracaceae bacterium]|nr:isochorismatase family protein [Bacteriovoracaceae bacterium]
MKIFLLSVVFFLSELSFAQIYKPAVFIIDMQISFFESERNIESKELLDLNLSLYKLINWAQENSLPIIIVEYENSGPTSPSIEGMVLKNNNYEKYTTIIKKDNGLFYEIDKTKEVKNFLDKYSVNSLIVSGINAHACVSETVVGAINNDYFVFTSRDLIAAFNYHPPIYPTTLYFEDDKLMQFDHLKDLFSYFKKKRL